MDDLFAELEKYPLTVFKYRKFFPDASKQRWWCELVMHGKIDYEHYRGWLHGYDTQQDVIDYHEFAGCYLKILREQGEYERSMQGKIDELRDSILGLENQVKYNRVLWQIYKEKEWLEFQDNLIEDTNWTKAEIERSNKKLIQLITGRH